MIGAVEAFLDMINRTIPDLIASFDAMWATITPGMEADVLRDVYSQVTTRRNTRKEFRM